MKSVKVLVAQSFPTLCYPMDCSLPASSVHGIFQARTLEWVAFSSSRAFPDRGMESKSLKSPALAGGFFTSATWDAQAMFSHRFITRGHCSNMVSCRRKK